MSQMPVAVEAVAQRPYPPTAYSWYLVAIMYLAYMVSFVDRQIIAFLVGPIRADLQITDFQFSLVHGLAFVMFYAMLGIPIGWLADHGNRKNIVAGGIALWSLMTASCGLANNFWQLFLARIGVGFGEATLSPCAVSLLADSFPPDRRALPINVYAAGVHGGLAFANIFGGVIAAFTAGLGTVHWLLVGELKPWQLSFVIVGLPGLLLAALAFTLREPHRRDQLASPAGVSIATTFRYLRRNWYLYTTLIAGTAISALGSYGMYSWVPALFERRFGWATSRIGLTFGCTILVCGTLGLVLSGWLVGRMMRAGKIAPHAKVMTAAMAMVIPCGAVLMLYDNPYWTLSCLALLILFMGMPIGLAQSALQAITPNEMRAQVIAVYLTAVSLVGLGTGPAAVAALTDFHFANDAAVGHSLSIVITAGATLSTIVLALSIGAHRREQTAR